MKKIVKNVITYLLVVAMVMTNVNTIVFAAEGEPTENTSTNTENSAAKEEPKAEEPKQEENKGEEPKQEQPKTDEGQQGGENKGEQPAQPTQPTQPTPEQPVQPVQPTPEQPTQPTQPTQPEQPVQPSQPVQPEQPVQPSQTVQPTQPTSEQPKTNEVEEVEKFAVVFVDTLDGDKIIANYVVDKGQGCDAPEAPEHEGYTFREWSEDFSEVNKPLIVATIYDRGYKVVFIDTLADEENKVIDEQIVKEGEGCEAPEIPEHEKYAIRGWSTDSYKENVTEDIEVNAEYDKLFTVVFKDTIADEVLFETTLKEGESCEVPEAPEHDGYIFKEWSTTDYSEVHDDLEVNTIYEEIRKPAFEQSVNGVTVKAKEGILPEGTELFVEEKDASSVKEQLNDELEGEHKQVNNIRLVDIKLKKDGEDIDFDGKVEIIIDLDTSDSSDINGFYKSGDNLEEIEAEEVGDGVSMDVTHFSEYGVYGTSTIPYKVSFDSKGGSVVADKETNNEGKVEKPADPTRDGFRFMGWFTDEECNTAFDFDNDTVVSDFTLYAKWEDKSQYTVTFDSDGGSAVVSQTVYDGDKVTRPTNPTKEGSYFVRWINTADNSDWLFNTNVVTSDITLKATWSEYIYYTVTFDSDGGTPIPEIQRVMKNNYAFKPTDPTKEHYTFVRWNKGTTSTQWYFTSNKVTQDITLKAYWQIDNYKITLNPMGGKFPSGSTSSYKYVNYNQKFTNDSSHTPEKNDRNFVGWCTDAGCTNDYDYDTPVDHAFTLYAKWSDVLDQYTVTFDTDGGNDIEPQSIYAGKKISKPANPDKDDYMFVKWVNKADNSDWDFNNDTVNSNIELKAIWTTDFYKVTYDANGGYFSDLTDIKVIKVVPNSKISSQSVYREGYSTTGWKEDGESTDWQFNTNTVTHDLVLKQGWVKKQYKVTTYANGGQFTDSTYNKIQYVDHGDTISASDLDTPVKEGYRFIGWYDSSSEAYADKFDFTKPITQATSIYAQWREADKAKVKYYITGCSQFLPWSRNVSRFVSFTFKAEGANDFHVGNEKQYYYDGENSEHYAAIATVSLHSHLSQPTLEDVYTVTCNGVDVPVRVLEGIYKDASCTERWDFDNDTVEDDMELYVKIIDQLLVSVHCDNISGSPTDYHIDTLDGTRIEHFLEMIISSYSEESKLLRVNSTSYTSRSNIVLADYYKPYKNKLFDDDNTRYKIIAENNKAGGTILSGDYTIDTWPGGIQDCTGNAYEQGYISLGMYADLEIVPLVKWWMSEPITGTERTRYSVGAVPDSLQEYLWKENYYYQDDLITLPTVDDSLYGGTDIVWKLMYKEPTLTESFKIKDTEYKDYPGISLYGKFTKHKIIFDSQGGSEVAMQKVPIGECATKPADPTKDGCSFVQWYFIDKSSGEHIAYNFSNEVNVGVTLYAQWRDLDNYTVTFDSDGGSAVDSQTIVEGGKIVKPANPSKDSHEFVKWVNKSDNSDWNFDNDTVTSNVELLAIWNYVAPTYTVTFDSDGGTPIDPQTIVEGGKIVKPTNPTKDNYEFVLWINKADNSGWDFNNETVTSNVELLATWNYVNPTTYQVTFDSDGGSMVDSQTIVEGGKVVKPTDPTKDLYGFVKWINKADNSDWDFDNDTITTNVELLAVWSLLPPNIYQVTFDSDGGSAVDTQFITEGMAALEPNPAPTKDHYDFVKWVNKADNSDWNFATPITSATELKAIWEKKTYTVTFDSDGGSSVPSQNVVYGNKATKPANPTKTDKVFEKWVNKADGSDWDFDTEISGPVELKAIWSDTIPTIYTVTFDSDGGSTVPTQNVTKGDKAIRPTNPTKANKVFEKWVNKADGSAWNFDNAITSNIALKAIWTNPIIIKYTVSFDSNGGSYNPDSQQITAGEKAVKPVDPTKEYYILVGWFNGSTLWNFNNPINNNIILKASWKKVKHTITFDANGGKFGNNTTITRNVEHESKINESGITTPTREGHTFKGWYKDATCNNAYNFNTEVKSAFTLYAKWEKTKYYVTFNSNGGSSVPYQIVEYGNKASKPSNPTRDGYTFKGWYLNGNTGYDFNKAVKSNIVLYAKWEKNPVPTVPVKPTPTPTPTPIVPPVIPTPKPTPTPVIPTPTPTPTPKPKPIVPEPKPEPVEPDPEPKPIPPTITAWDLDLPIETADEFESTENLTNKKYTYVETHENGYKLVGDDRILKDLYKLLSQRTEEDKVIYKYKRTF